MAVDCGNTHRNRNAGTLYARWRSVDEMALLNKPLIAAADPAE